MVCAFTCMRALKDSPRDRPAPHPVIPAKAGIQAVVSIEEAIAHPVHAKRPRGSPVALVFRLLFQSVTNPALTAGRPPVFIYPAPPPVVEGAEASHGILTCQALRVHTRTKGVNHIFSSRASTRPAERLCAAARDPVLPRASRISAAARACPHSRSPVKGLTPKAICSGEGKQTGTRTGSSKRQEPMWSLLPGEPPLNTSGLVKHSAFSRSTKDDRHTECTLHMGSMYEDTHRRVRFQKISSCNEHVSRNFQAGKHSVRGLDLLRLPGVPIVRDALGNEITRTLSTFFRCVRGALQRPHSWPISKDRFRFPSPR